MRGSHSYFIIGHKLNGIEVGNKVNLNLGTITFMNFKHHP